MVLLRCSQRRLIAVACFSDAERWMIEETRRATDG